VDWWMEGWMDGGMDGWMWEGGRNLCVSLPGSANSSMCLFTDSLYDSVGAQSKP
jgi:hypothetical protein